MWSLSNVLHLTLHFIAKIPQNYAQTEKNEPEFKSIILCSASATSSYFPVTSFSPESGRVREEWKLGGNKIPGVILHRCTATRSSLCKNHFLPKVIYPSSRGLFAWGYLHLWRPVISGYHLGACRIYFSFCLPSAAVSFPGRTRSEKNLRI